MQTCAFCFCCACQPMRLFGLFNGRARRTIRGGDEMKSQLLCQWSLSYSPCCLSFWVWWNIITRECSCGFNWQESWFWIFSIYTRSFGRFLEKLTVCRAGHFLLKLNCLVDIFDDITTAPRVRRGNSTRCDFFENINKTWLSPIINKTITYNFNIEMVSHWTQAWRSVWKKSKT